MRFLAFLFVILFIAILFLCRRAHIWTSLMKSKAYKRSTRRLRPRPKSIEAPSRTHKAKIVCPWPGCNFRSPSKYQMKVHGWTHTNAGPYPCSDCGYGGSASPSALKKHRRSHTNERPFRCLKCEGARFRSWDTLDQHMKKQHPSIWYLFTHVFPNMQSSLTVHVPSLAGPHLKPVERPLLLRVEAAAAAAAAASHSASHSASQLVHRYQTLTASRSRSQRASPPAHLAASRSHSQ
jgi:hypothetical protein